MTAERLAELKQWADPGSEILDLIAEVERLQAELAEVRAENANLRTRLQAPPEPATVAKEAPDA